MRPAAVRILPGSLSALCTSEHDDRVEQARAMTDSLISFIIVENYEDEPMRSMVKTDIQAHGKDELLALLVFI